MHMIHGLWIPDDTTDFTQVGAFYLWVETDAPVGKGRKRAEAVHPRHLAQAALAAFLIEKLGVREFMPGTLVRTLTLQHVLLPTAEGAPLPSFELLRYVDEETPAASTLAPWPVWCYRVPDVIATLNDIHFLALHAAEDFQLGADFLFWQQYTQALKGVIAADHYIPALKYCEFPSRGGKRAKTAPAFELYHGWELLSETYEATITRYTTAMPAACRAGLSRPDET